MAKLIKRLVIDKIRPYLNENSVVVLHGARQVGKTSIMMYLKDELVSFGQQVFYLDLEDIRILDALNGGVDDLISYLRAAGADFSAAEKNESKISVRQDTAHRSKI